MKNNKFVGDGSDWVFIPKGKPKKTDKKKK
jgi:hypothetical protein